MVDYLISILAVTFLSLVIRNGREHGMTLAHWVFAYWFLSYVPAYRFPVRGGGL